MAIVSFRTLIHPYLALEDRAWHADCETVSIPDTELDVLQCRQLVELQNDLKGSTERMLSGNRGAEETLKAPQQSQTDLPGDALLNACRKVDAMTSRMLQCQGGQVD